MFARIGIMRALNRNHVREFNPDRKPHHWGNRTETGHGMKLTHRFAELTPEKRPQNPHMDGTGLRFETASPKPKPIISVKCPGCGQWFDMRDLRQMLAHVHDAEIEIGEGPAPAPEGPLQ